MKKQTFLVENKVGLHAKPGAMFVFIANSYKSAITDRNKTTETPFKNAKSIMGLLQLAIKQNHQIEVMVEGDDEAAALEAIAEVIDQINHVD
jgi:phosphocarrier protein